MDSTGPIMYERLVLDDYEVEYTETHKCYGCQQYFETAPVMDDEGNLFCSERCRDDEPHDSFFSDEEGI